MSQDTHQFQSQHAIQWGLPAAILLSYIQQQQAQPVVGTLAQWQQRLPFLSPAEITQGIESLLFAGVLRQHPAPVGQWHLSWHGTDSEPGYDEPPPPAPTPQLLTEHVTYIDSPQAAERYSDEPLYGRDHVAEIPSTGQRALMTLDWQPSADCLSMIAQRGISAEFALAQRGNFVLYYRDSGQRHLSWDTKFLNWVGRCWQYHLNDQKQAHGLTTEQSMATTRGKRDSVRAKLRDITDTSW